MPPNMPPIDVPLLGRSGWIAVIALLHIPFFVNFVMGAPVLAVISEYLGIKTNDARYEKLARDLSRMALVTVGVGAFGGVGLVASNLGLFPKFFSLGANAFFWPLVLELPAFLFEGIFIAVYYYTWKSLENRRGLHMMFGVFGAIGAWGSGIIINGLATFMLTPGRWVETRSWLHMWFNPTSLPAFTHRAVAAFSISSFFIMIYALWMGRAKRSEEDQGYAAWLLYYAGRWAVLSTALQFVPGVWYMVQAHRGTEAAAPEGSIIPKLLGGQLTPFWFGGIIIAAGAILVVWFTAVQRSKQSLRGLGRILIVASVAAILVTTAFMGFTRERSRKPYLIYGVMYGNELLVGPPGAGPAAPSSPTLDAAPLFQKKCAICHKLAGDGGTVGPELDALGQRRTADEVAALLAKPPAAMPPFVGSEEEKASLIAYLLNSTGAPTAGTPDTAPAEPGGAGDSIFQKRCTICHSRSGQGGTVGPALDDVGNRYDGSAIRQLLQSPPAGMPPFVGSDEDMQAVVDFLVGQ